MFVAIRWLSACSCSMVLCLAASLSFAQDGTEVWAKPIEIGGVSVSLPEPSLVDSMSAAEQEAVLKQVAGKYPLDRFLKDSIVAPFHLERENLKNDQGERVGHRVDLWFVAYGSLEAIRDEDLFAAMVDAEPSDRGEDSGRELTKEELAARGLVDELDDELDDERDRGFYRFSVDVMDRVLVQGVVQTTIRSSEASHFASIRLDPRFREDEAFPNQWRHLDGTADDFQPYSGLAGYAKATRLLGHPGAILVECHAVLHEPADWFRGANLLSSKLPLATQDAVRSFRRKLGN